MRPSHVRAQPETIRRANQNCVEARRRRTAPSSWTEPISNDVETTTTRYEIGDPIDCVDGRAYRVVDVIDRAPDYGGAPLDETSQYVAFLFVEPLEHS